jgi:hypothetical protein
VRPSTTTPYVTQKFIDHKNNQIFTLWNGAILAIVYQGDGYRFINAEGNVKDYPIGRQLYVISSNQHPIFGKAVTPTNNNNVIIEQTRNNKDENIKLESISAIAGKGDINKEEIKIYPSASQTFQWSSVQANTIISNDQKYWTINGCNHYALNNCNGTIKNAGVILVDKKGHIEAVNPPSKDKNSYLHGIWDFGSGGALVQYTNTPNLNIFLSDGTFLAPADNNPDLGAIPAPENATSIKGIGNNLHVIFYHGANTVTVINNHTGLYNYIEPPKNAGAALGASSSPENNVLIEYQLETDTSKKSPTVVSVNIDNGK